MGIFKSIWDGLRRLIGLIIPFFAKVGDFRAWSPAARRVLHFVVLVTVLAALVALQYWVRPPQIVPPFNYIWLPSIFLVVYGLCWSIWWFFYEWFRQEPSEFPDLDSAWEEAIRAMREKGIDLQDVPLFLVLGRPEAGDESLFQAAKLPLTVKPAPARPDAPLHVWANKQDGIFVTCADASRLCFRATLLALEGAPADDLAAEPAHIAVDRTIGGDSKPKYQRVVDEQLPLEERQRRLKALELADKPEVLRRLSARLEHLCRLIGRDRWPEPPANGILVLVPFAAARSDKAAEAITKDCRHDLGSAWQMFRLNCPLYAVICDLETAPGFPVFLERYLAQFKTAEQQVQRKRRLGRGLGWGVGLDHATRRNMVEDQVHWIGRGMLPIQVYKGMLRLETPQRENTEDVVRENFQLCRFLGAMRAGHKRLARIVGDGLVSKPGGLDLLGGCYLAATGRDARIEQAFAASLFQDKLLGSMRYIAWTKDALEENASLEAWTRNGYIALPFFIGGVVVLILLAIFFWL